MEMREILREPLGVMFIFYFIIGQIVLGLLLALARYLLLKYLETEE